jgi:hypothetical protein
MEQITKSQKSYLIKHGIIKIINGKIENLHIVGKNKKSNRKTYYTINRFANILKRRNIL